MNQYTFLQLYYARNVILGTSSSSFPLAFPIAGITDDLSSPHRSVRLLARSQSSTFQISLTRVFPSCFRSSSLPLPWYIRPQHFPQYVFAISPHHMPVPVESSLGDLFGSLRHSCCSSDVFIPDLVFACHSIVASSSRSPQSVFLVSSL